MHCRRGISRSASTVGCILIECLSALNAVFEKCRKIELWLFSQVIAYLMKEDNLALADAMKFVKSKRSIVQPNSGFWKQLIVYEGILRSRWVSVFSLVNLLQYVAILAAAFYLI